MDDSIERFKEIFRENLQRFRTEAGYTQVELSEASGFEASYVGKLERGEADPSLESIRKITGALDLSPEELLLPSTKRPDEDQVDVEDKLKVQEVELEMQQEELDRTEAELRESLDRYRSWFQHSPVPLVAVREHGTIVEANAPFHRVFSRAETNLQGQHINEFLYPEDRDEFYRYRQNVGDPSQDDSVILRFGESDEDVRFYRVESALVDLDDAEPCFLISFQDVNRWMNESSSQAH